MTLDIDQRECLPHTKEATCFGGTLRVAVSQRKAHSARSCWNRYTVILEVGSVPFLSWSQDSQDFEIDWLAFSCAKSSILVKISASNLRPKFTFTK